jgi:maltose O-acetyltransferase
MKSILRRVYYEGLLYIANRVVARMPCHCFRLFFYRRVFGFSIGRSSSIFMDAWFDTKGKGSFILGDGSVVNQKCRLDNRGGIEIGNSVAVAAEVCILTADHDVRAHDLVTRYGKVTIGDYAFIGTRAMLLPGVRIGRGAAVGAGSVVTKDVPDYTVVAGCPAKPIGTRSEPFEYSTAYTRLFH